MNTYEYRQAELNKIGTEYSEYKPKLKIIKPDGETKWLDITETELAQIKNVLLDYRMKGAK